MRKLNDLEKDILWIFFGGISIYLILLGVLSLVIKTFFCEG